MNCAARASPRRRSAAFSGPHPRTSPSAIDSRVAGIHQQRGASGGLLRRGAVGREHGAPARHRLQDGQPERLVERGVREEVGRAVEVDRLLEGHPADPHDVVGDAELLGECLELRDVRLVAQRADDDELVPVQGRLGQRERPHQPVAVLVGPQRRHEEDEGGRHALRPDPRPRLVRVAGPEDGVVHRLRHHPELGRVDVQVALHLGPEALGVEDDRVGDLRGVRVAEPPVGARQRSDRLRLGEGVHGLEVRHQAGRRLDQRGDERVEHVDPRRPESRRQEQLLGEGPELGALVRPGSHQVADARPVVLVERTRAWADHEVQLLVVAHHGGDLGDDPGPAPVRARRGGRVVGEQVDRDLHDVPPGVPDQYVVIVLAPPA